jgi:hypothetical protein
VFAIPAEWAIGGPALNNQIMRFVKSLPRIGWVNPVGEILHAGPDDHARDHSALRNHVEHSDLFGHPLRMIVKRQNIAQDDQFCLLGSPGETRRHDVRRGHPTVGGLMMFVYANTVEAELIGQLQLVQIAVVKRMAEFWVIKRVGTSYPSAFVRLKKVLGKISPGHQMKAVYFHSMGVVLPDGLNDLNRQTPYGLHPVFLSTAATSAARLKSNTS